MKNLSFLKSKLFRVIIVGILTIIVALLGKDGLSNYFFNFLFQNVVTDNSVIINKKVDMNSAASLQTQGSHSPATNQNGQINIAGDNNKACIKDCFNMKEKPRELTEAMKTYLEGRLPSDKSIEINIQYLMGDAETGQLANKIFDYFDKTGRRNAPGPAAVIPSPNYSFDAGVHYRETTRTIEIGVAP